MFPTDFFSHLAKEKNRFSEAKTVKIRGYYDFIFSDKKYKIPVYKVILKEISSNGFDAFKINIPDFLVKKSIVSPENVEELRSIVLSEIKTVKTLVKKVSKKVDYAYEDSSAEILKDKKPKSNVSIMNNGSILIIASEFKT